jgi:tight adherence protein C
VAIDGFAMLLGGLSTVVLAAVAGAVLTLRREVAPLLRRGDENVIATTAKLRTAALAAGDATENEAKARLRRQLVQAGLRSPAAPQVFLAAKVILGTVALGAVALANSIRVEPLPNALTIAVCGTAGGFFLPNLWLRSRRAARLREIDRALPEALDLLVTCVEAGLGLDAALQRVALETELAFPVLSGELRLAFLEVKAGIPRIDALRRLADRTGSRELRALAATLAQTEMFGTSVGGALRIQAESIRIRRMQIAEEKAAYISVKMTFPLVLCILPAVFAVLVGPAIVNIVERLLPLMGGR